MKLKLNQSYDNFLRRGAHINRVGANTIEITSPSDIRVSILLPENFELETKALEQLLDFAHFKTPDGRSMKCACATPDFHTGTQIPVGSVVVSPEDVVLPSAIGTDINCGMRLHHTGLTLGEYLPRKKELLSKLKGDLLEGTRDIPTTGAAMASLFEGGLPAFWESMRTTKKAKGIFDKVNYAQVEAELKSLHTSAFLSGNIKYAPENLLKREWLRDPQLATLGGGNHFCEIQVVKEIVDKKAAYELGLKVGHVVVMLHTGSRDVGFYVGRGWMDRARALYPKTQKEPEHKIFALEGELAQEYLTAMTGAAHYATVNRALLAEVVRQRIYEVYGERDNRLITDVPHNIITQESFQTANGLIKGNVHRKGATPAALNQMLLIPGSMGSESYLLNGLGNDNWLSSASHGAGRSVSRQQMTFKGKKDANRLGLEGVDCITLKEERKIEEAPSAYKEIGPVIASQVSERTVDVIAVFSPLTTFKA